MLKKKTLAAHYCHVHNGGIEFQIQKVEGDTSSVVLHIQTSNFGCVTEHTIPIDVTVAQWLMTSLPAILPALESSSRISDIIPEADVTPEE